MTANGAAHIGTSGWMYDHWSERFYPKEIKKAQWLDYYTSRFQTVEINSTFYHLPRRETFENWRARTPENFVFTIKGSRYITHIKKLTHPAESVGKFVENAGALGEKLGAILFQLPQRFALNAERFEAFLAVLPREIRCAFELRNPDWFTEEVFGLLRQYGVAFCLYDFAGRQTPREITADFVYLRLHGPGEAYQGQYSDETLRSWANDFAGWLKEGRDVFCYFDNDQNAYAAHDALRLNALLAERLHKKMAA